MSVVIETTVGDITIDLYTDERPRTCLNFLKLCKIKYYNFCLFHKIERSFIAQSGDPTGTGRGGESVFVRLYGDQAKYFDAEMRPKIKHKKLGTVSMVNNGNNMNGSQFFITLGEDLTYLDEIHSVFGEVVQGFDVLVKLNDTICDSGNGRPYQDIRITHTVILHDPYEDPADLEIPPSSPVPTKEILSSDYVGADEEIDDTKGRSMEEVEEEIKEKEAKARATILEMVGDIPDAEVKPPENVLFVCKLNPVTTSEDLEVIFSRFGAISSCEVIKDKNSGESLQYAFIEFEKEEDCENAYFKMDNVLIDDRRIHVDFSQSVAKLNYFQGNKGPIPKNNSGREKLVIKQNARKEDYEMVFDSEGENESTEKKKSQKHSKRQSTSPSGSPESRRRRSPSPSMHGSQSQSSSKHHMSPTKYRDRSSKSSKHQSRSPSFSKHKNPSSSLPRSSQSSSHKHSSESKSHRHHHHKHKQRSRSSSPEHKKHKSHKKNKKSRK